MKTEISRISGFDLPVEEWVKESEIDEEIFVEKIIQCIDEKLEARNAHIPADIVRMIEKNILLQELDQLWKDHIATLDYMRHTIVLRAYGQKDPLNEYKKEAFNLFSEMLDVLGEKVSQILLRLEIRAETPNNMPIRRSEPQNIQAIHENPDSVLNPNPKKEDSLEKKTPFQYGTQEFNAADPNTWGKISRNDPCPCGSGKKFKHCHGKI